MFRGCSQTVLEIEERPLECQCGMCGHRFPGRRYLPAMPGRSVRIVSGELYVDYYEGEALDVRVDQDISSGSQ